MNLFCDLKVVALCGFKSIVKTINEKNATNSWTFELLGAKKARPFLFYKDHFTCDNILSRTKFSNVHSSDVQLFKKFHYNFRK